MITDCPKRESLNRPFVTTIRLAKKNPPPRLFTGQTDTLPMAKKKSIKVKKLPASVRIDLTGHKYGRLTVLGFAGYRGSALLWSCQCECGNVGTYIRNNLRSGTSTQCIDCAHEDRRETSATHGMWGTVEYRAWERIRKHENVCARWRKFENFYEDVGDKPSPKYIMARKNTKLGWRPSNAGWSPPNPTRRRANTKLIRFRGKSQSVSEWAEEVGLSPSALRNRLNNGWTVKEALTIEPMR